MEAFMLDGNAAAKENNTLSVRWCDTTRRGQRSEEAIVDRWRIGSCHCHISCHRCLAINPQAEFLSRVPALPCPALLEDVSGLAGFGIFIVPDLAQPRQPGTTNQLDWPSGYIPSTTVRRRSQNSCFAVLLTLHLAMPAPVFFSFISALRSCSCYWRAPARPPWDRILSLVPRRVSSFCTVSPLSRAWKSTFSPCPHLRLEIAPVASGRTLLPRSYPSFLPRMARMVHLHHRP